MDERTGEAVRGWEKPGGLAAVVKHPPGKNGLEGKVYLSHGSQMLSELHTVPG